MRCPWCSSLDVKVVDSRHRLNACSRRRRYHCNNCKERYSTLEYYYIDGLFEEQLSVLDQDTEKIILQKLDRKYHINPPPIESAQRVLTKCPCPGCDGRGFVYIEDLINRKLKN